MPIKERRPRPAQDLEAEVIKSEMESGIRAGVNRINGKTEPKQETFHNTKYLLKEYRRVAYSVKISESELNLRAEMEHNVPLSALEVNAELAGIDLSGTELEGYTRSVVRSRNMLRIIDEALKCVRADPERGEQMYQLLYQTYFTPQKPKNRECILMTLDRLGFPMSPTTYHFQLNIAIKALDRILWGYTAQDCIEIIKGFLPD